jgi:polyhydroxyalkanoate synthesis regulator phasin
MRKLVLLVIVLAAAPVAVGLALAAGDDPGTKSQSTTASAPSADKSGATPVRRTADADRHEKGRNRTPAIFGDATDEEIADIMAFTGEYLPWVRQDLEKMQKSDPEHFRQVVRRLRFEVAQLRSMKERDPAAFQKAIEERQLKARAQDLAAKIRAADAQEKEAFTAELRKVLDKLFDAEMVTREANIRGLEERLTSLKRELKERSAHRQEILQKRMEQTIKGNVDSNLSPLPERPQPKK